MLADQIEAIKRREAAQKLDEGESVVALQLAQKLRVPKPELDEPTRQLLAPFLEWSARHSVRHAAAKPTSVASFVLAQKQSGAADDDILATLGAIEKLHWAYGLSNPVASPTVNAALEQVLNVKPPKSWPKEDKAMFASLPAQIRSRIATRENQRDRELRRIQNEHAEFKRNIETKKESENVQAIEATP